MRSAVSSVIAAARQRYAVAKGGTVAFLAMRATRGALGTNFCYGCGGDTLLATGTTVVRCHCAVARASGSGTFQWLVVPALRRRAPAWCRHWREWRQHALNLIRAVAATHCCDGNDGGSVSLRGPSGRGTLDWIVERQCCVVTEGSGGSTR